MDNGKDDIVREILAYLAEHPDARDTVEGIAEWWLTERSAPRPVAEVAAALDGLVAEGLLVEERRAGASVYHVERLKLPEIRRRLGWTGPAGPVGAEGRR